MNNKARPAYFPQPWVIEHSSRILEGRWYGIQLRGRRFFKTLEECIAMFHSVNLEARMYQNIQFRNRVTGDTLPVDLL